MNKKIVLIGKKSFVSLNLAKNLNKKFLIRIMSLEEFMSLDQNYLSSINYIINCSINKKYAEKKYSIKNDFDLKIARKIKKFNINYIFLGTRKIYKIGDNLKENSKLLPNCNYSKNKLKTEKKLLNLLKNKVLILRISNLIGNLQISSSRKIHNTFISQFFFNIKNNLIYDNKNSYKDFLSVNQFSKIIEKLIQKNSHGIFNISMGKKVFLKNIIEWLNHYNKKHTIKVKLPKKLIKNQNFYLNNSKLIREINLKISLTKLEKDCKDISKSFFK